jgi:hypothetical protein
MPVEPTFAWSISSRDLASRPGPAPAWRRSRVELRQAVRGFARAVAEPADEPAWSERARHRLNALRDQLTEHVVATEGPDGLYAELLEHAPRLSRPVAGLVADHGALLVHVDALRHRLRGPGHQAGSVRESARELLAALARHRQRGADLLYEAYATDIGGET